MRTRRVAKAGTFAASLILSCATVLAQSQANTGIIEGLVSDPSGKAVARAQVVITNLGTNFTRELMTDDQAAEVTQLA